MTGLGSSFLFLEKIFKISIIEVTLQFRAHSKPVLRLHGMEEDGVQFPVGPQFAISQNFRLARAFGAGLGGQKIKVIPRLFVIYKKPLVQNSAVRADFFDKIFHFWKIVI